MPNEATTPPQGESGEVIPAGNLEEAFDRALASTGANLETPVVEETPAVPASPEEQAAPVVEPDHVRWLKSKQGYYDEKGQPNVDLIVKHLHASDQWNQRLARDNAEFKRVLQQRDQELVSKSKEEEPRERTDAEYFDELVRGKIKEEIKPVLERNARLHHDLVQREVVRTVTNLRETFGSVDDGKGGKVYIYDSILPEISQTVAGILERSGRPIDQASADEFVTQLVDAGMLETVYRNIAVNILYPRMAQQLSATQATHKQQEVTRENNTRLPAKGSNSRLLKQEIQVNSIEDAARLAEQELGYKLS